MPLIIISGVFILNNRKDIIRKNVLQKRRLLGEDERNEKSKAIIERLINSREFKNSSVIMCYVDFDGEAKTQEFIESCLRMGKRVTVPMVVKNTDGSRDLIASEIFDLEKDLDKGTFGVLEPKKDAVRNVEPSEIDMVVVPGVAFDINKNRVGYGAGFYDRFLKKLGKECFTVGIAFDFQVCDSVESDDFDVPVKMIITESGVF